MTTFSTQIFSCPHCNKRMYTYELSSYHVYSSEVYSDGYVDNNPPVSLNKQIVICHYCHREIWREDISFEESYSTNDLPKCKDVYDLPIGKDLNSNHSISTYYLKLIENGFANTKDREIHLRTEIWHLLNNTYRYGGHSVLHQLLLGRYKYALHRFKQRKQFRKESIEARILLKENLKNLIKIYIPENDDDWLWVAEMQREIGNFRQASSSLRKIATSPKSDAYKLIKKKIFLRQSKVFKLN